MILLRYGSAIERLGNRCHRDDMLGSGMADICLVRLPQTGST